MKKLYTFLFGKRYYWYYVKFTYKSKKGTVIFDYSEYIGLVNQEDILNFRKVKRASSIRSKMKDLPETLLVNGNLVAEPVAYIGWLKYPQNT